MLTSVTSNVLRSGTVEFHAGLNVVLGDDNATNSIGKSSLLMIVDFAFGGSSLLAFNTDLVAELGHHSYDFTFAFEDGEHRFRRQTSEPDVVRVLANEDDVEDGGQQITIESYRAFLGQAYGISSDYLSFRALVGLFSRIWGKDNLEVRHPLHSVQRQAARECIDNLLKTYGSYDAIGPLSERLAELHTERRAIDAAVRRNVLPKVGKRDYVRNESRIARVESELKEIKVHLASYATSLSQLVDREMLELKSERDELAEVRSALQSRLNRVRRNISQNRHLKSKHFEALREFFPEIDAERIARIEEFHNDLAQLLRRELRDSERDTTAQLAAIDDQLRSIDERMGAVLGSVDQPSLIVDRVVSLATDLRDARRANEQFDRRSGLTSAIEETGEALGATRSRALSAVEEIVNSGMQSIVRRVFGPERKSPRLSLGEATYVFEVFEDTGTGTAYSSLLVFDLTVFSQTTLPIVVHDSLLFKNVENQSVSQLMLIYSEAEKQSFVAIDEVEKYGDATAALLREKAVEYLSNTRVLFIKDWRHRPSTG